ncbi:undecaprenyl-diphosphate phosphatase [Acidianus manzaensis]|uniref:Undecaprenyl-diphosphatase n=1 Tax=Acidianus manzaensis TaxID=282676 RepID=A0A1W6K177_9CREN|nr:undecaprenyl-diphosphate phosphatase [Acidianus manzaensis]ARM76194.1 undecaprenyl-diphosphatase [Acidianus manzaensis]
MDLLFSILIGIIQGITEWLPISSKTQVLLSSEFLLGISVAVAYSFGLFMELGSIGSALIYFRHDVKRVFKERKLLIFLVVATFFTGLVGVPLFLISDKLLQNAYNPGIPMLVLGLILIGDGIYIKFSRQMKNREFKEMSLRDMIIIGIAQGIAALPGVSRSGMTVSTMLLLGYKPEDAFRYSYLAYIPAALGAVGTTLLFTKHSISIVVSQIGFLGIFTALIFALITGVLVISFLLKIAKKNTVYFIDFTLGLIAIIISSLIILGI